ncbi:hypothetical protein AZA_49228 [Nitrospirillum viridazoti Y2]|nr:hypothetical protein AZA_49228 [Nitrospirillum amazonense Y2]
MSQYIMICSCKKPCTSTAGFLKLSIWCDQYGSCQREFTESMFGKLIDSTIENIKSVLINKLSFSCDASP